MSYLRRSALVAGVGLLLSATTMAAAADTSYYFRVNEWINKSIPLTPAGSSALQLIPRHDENPEWDINDWEFYPGADGIVDDWIQFGTTYFDGAGTGVGSGQITYTMRIYAANADRPNYLPSVTKTFTQTFNVQQQVVAGVATAQLTLNPGNTEVFDLGDYGRVTVTPRGDTSTDTWVNNSTSGLRLSELAATAAESGGGTINNDVTFTVTTGVPEPTACGVMLASGLLVLRRRRAAACV